MSNEKIFIGNIIHCEERFVLKLIENGYLVVKDGIILELGFGKNLEEIKSPLKLSNPEVVKLKSNQLLIPGLIDTHIHAPQYPNCGLGYDKTLMDWLNNYTFPLEAQYDDLEFSKKVYDAVVVSLGSVYHR